MSGQVSFDQDALGGKARRGVALLILRTVLLQLTVLGGNVVLARALDPGHFGVFAIVQFALSFFAFFGDAGLGGALVQKKEEPSQRELSSVFCLQLLIVAVLMAAVFAFAAVLRDIWPALPEGTE